MGEKTYRAIIAIVAFIAVGGFVAWFITNHLRSEKELKLRMGMAARAGSPCDCKGEQGGTIPSNLVRSADGYILNPTNGKYAPEALLNDLGIYLT